MTSNAEVIRILDEAQKGDYDSLNRLFISFLRPGDPDLIELVTDSMLAVLRKMGKGDTSIVLAPQLGGILRNCKKQLLDRQIQANEKLAISIDQLEDKPAFEIFDPANAVVRKEQVDAEVAMLKELKEKNPRHHAVLVADVQGVAAVEYFKEVRGEHLTPEYARQLRRRAKNILKKGSQEIRKDSSS